jgi:hypothetical protein
MINYHPRKHIILARAASVSMLSAVTLPESGNQANFPPSFFSGQNRV